MLVQFVNSPVFRALQHSLRHQTCVGQLVHTDARQNIFLAADGLAFGSLLRSKISMTGKVKAGFQEVIKGFRIVEYKHHAEVFYAQT